MSKFESVNKFVNSAKGEFSKTWSGYDGEYFEDNKFFVDGTCLCKIDKDVMFLPVNSITPKCSLYIRELTLRASDLNMHVAYVPQWYSCDLRSHQFSEDDIVNSFTITIDKLKDRRDIYSKQQLEDTRNTLVFINNNCFGVSEDLFTKIGKLLEKMEAATCVGNKEVKKFIDENCYYDLVTAAYFSNEHNMMFKTALKQYLNPSGEYAFLNYNWEDDTWYSSESVCGVPKATMTGEQGWDLLHHYRNGTLKHGMKFGDYTIMKVMDSYLQISCNRYSRTMMDSLLDLQFFHVYELGMV